MTANWFDTVDTAAESLVACDLQLFPTDVQLVVRGYVESRALQVGLRNENAALRARLKDPETLDLDEVPDDALMAEIAHRLKVRS